MDETALAAITNFLPGVSTGIVISSLFGIGMGPALCVSFGLLVIAVVGIFIADKERKD